MTRDTQAQINWRNLALNNVNNSIVLVWSISNLINMCPKTGPFSWFTSDECFLTPYGGVAHVMSFMIGFLVYDYINLKFFFLELNKLNK